MDSRFSAQDIQRCTLCKHAVAPMYCDTCRINICKDCVESHVSDVSIDHKVVLLKHRGSIPDYSICSKHKTKQRDLHCEQCNISICVECTSSIDHRGHNFLYIKEKILERKERVLKDLGELEKSLHQKYEEISSNIQVQKDILTENSQTVKTAISNHGDDLHQEVESLITKLKSDLDKTESKQLASLNKQQNEVAVTISEIKKSIARLRKLSNSNDDSLLLSYNSRNAEFRNLPHEIEETLPSFTPSKINREQLHKQIGSLSFTTKGQLCTKVKQGVKSSLQDRLLPSEPSTLITIETGYRSLYSVSCIGDEEIWTCGLDNIMRLYNIQGELVKSIQTKSGNLPQDISVTRDGELIYVDHEDRSVNLVNNKKIKAVVRLQGWKPRNVCCTSSGGFLVMMIKDENKQSRVLRYTGSEKHTFQFNDNGKLLYSSGGMKYVSENKNQDICVADNKAQAIVVINKNGKHRFSYTGPPSASNESFDPVGITTDNHGQILTTDCRNHRIHILDQNGQFLRFIDNCGLHTPWGLCVDTHNRLLVAESKSGLIKEIRYDM